MKVIVCTLFSVLQVIVVVAQEMTIPVGLEGRDTLTTIRNYDAVGNYDVGYNENQLTGGASFYREQGYINGTRTGSYGYTTRNGLIRIVTYVADEKGYRAEVLTNEPGVSPVNSADVSLTKEKEPDAEALAAGPTGVPIQSSTQQSSVVYSSDAVLNYVASASAPVAVPVDGHQGSATVTFSAPYGQYHYVI